MVYCRINGLLYAQSETNFKIFTKSWNLNFKSKTVTNTYYSSQGKYNLNYGQLVLTWHCFWTVDVFWFPQVNFIIWKRRWWNFSQCWNRSILRIKIDQQTSLRCTWCHRRSWRCLRSHCFYLWHLLVFCIWIRIHAQVHQITLPN